MTSQSAGKTRFWIATTVVVLIVIAVWKFIDWRMQPPPPPNKVVVPVPAPSSSP